MQTLPNEYVIIIKIPPQSEDALTPEELKFYQARSQQIVVTQLALSRILKMVFVLFFNSVLVI